MLPTSDDYLSFLMSLPNMNFDGLLTLFFLGLMRVAPIVSIVPFLGAKLPGGVKMGLAIALTFILMPQLALTTHSVVGFDMNFVGYSLKELFLGFIIAFLAATPFYIAQSSGTLIDFMRGSSSLQVPDPLMQSQTSPIGVLFNYILIVLFFQIGGPFFFLDALYASYHFFPIDKVLPALFFHTDNPLWKMLFGLLNKVTLISIQLAAPAIVSILMAEMFLGIANRLAPQVQIVFLGMSLKSLLGLGLLWAGWFFILQQMAKQSLFWIREIEEVLTAFTP